MALEVAELSVTFGAVRALDNVSLRVPTGAFVGLIGPNGAGKTTLFDAVSGFCRPDQGRIRFCGRRINGWSPHRRARAGLARTFQNLGLNKSATVLENLHIANEVGRGLAYEARALVLNQGVDGQAESLAEVIELLGLGDVLAKRIVELPLGSNKLVELACVLLRRPRLLLLDEPSSGVAQDETGRLLEVLRRVHGSTSLSILMIEHDMQLTMAAVDYLYVLNFGQLLAEGTPAEVRAHPAVIEAYLGRRGVER
jgi:branched-chain amino acid transport system ATP-binding protein